MSSGLWQWERVHSDDAKFDGSRITPPKTPQGLTPKFVVFNKHFSTRPEIFLSFVVYSDASTATHMG